MPDRVTKEEKVQVKGIVVVTAAKVLVLFSLYGPLLHT